MFCECMHEAGYRWSEFDLGNHNLTTLYQSYQLTSWFPAELEQVKELDQALRQEFGGTVGSQLWSGPWNGYPLDTAMLRLSNRHNNDVIEYFSHHAVLRVFREALLFYGFALYVDSDNTIPLQLVRSCV
jgi:hypothetical protein